MFCCRIQSVHVSRELWCCWPCHHLLWWTKQESSGGFCQDWEGTVQEILIHIYVFLIFFFYILMYVYFQDKQNCLWSQQCHRNNSGERWFMGFMNCSLNMYKYIRYHYTFYIPQLILVVRLPKVNDMFNITFIIPDLQGRSIKLKKKTIQTFERILFIYVYTCKYSEFSSYIEISCLVNFSVTFKDDPIAYLMYNP